MADDRPVTRDDIASIERRVDLIERELLSRSGVATTRCPRCARTVQEGRFCSACGAILHPAAPVPAAPPAPAAPRAPIAPSTPLPGVARTPAAAPAPAPARMDMEKLLGQRWAPRVGAVLVFLAIVFFLGVAIQRGWIGPLLQLALAALTGLTLVTLGEILSARRGYGTYPQVLQATGTSALYVTAFVAHALPYYRATTGLTEIGSAILMATVAIGTVALALRHDARVIAGLGFSLAFLTALLGADALPALTLAYVAVLGSGLAVLVARKSWTIEGLVGSLSTGGLLLWLAAKAERAGDPAPLAVALAALVPAALFLWLATRPARQEADAPLAAILTLATFAWGSVATLALTDADAPTGVILLVWAFAALGHAVLAARAGARATLAAAGAAAVVFWLIGAQLAWSDWVEAELLTTMSYALAALALGGFARVRPRASGAWIAALVLAGGAALYALLVQGALHAPWERSTFVFGGWQAWATLVLLAAALAPILATSGADARARAAAFWIAAAFGALWTFALFGAALPATLWLVALAAVLVGIAAAPRERDATLAGSAIAAALAVLAIAALKVTIIDSRVPAVKLDATSAALQTLLVAATMLALHALARARSILPDATAAPAAVALVGGSALVIASYVLEYTDDAWPSILLGALGVAYLATGLARRTLTMYRYTGFAVLGFVLVRVFLVDLGETDLAIRALVFAVLGGILLGVGYVYARISRREERAGPPPKP